MRTATRLLHDGWTFREVGPAPLPNTDLTAWLPAEVPGHVHLDLLRNGVIPDPFERQYERTVQWVDHTGWEYRCTFAVTEEERTGARHVLVFDGLDTVAEVELNGEVVLQADNMFVPHEVEVTARLLTGENTLSVRFASAQATGAERRTAWLAADDERAVFRRGASDRTFVRKAQYAWGWDWGPCLRGCGIWQAVRLVRVEHARVAAWAHRVRFEDDGSATLTVTVDVDGDADLVTASLGRRGWSFTGGGAVAGGRATFEVRVDEPVRWWPAGQGKAALYDLELAVTRDGEVVDTLTARVGLREVALVREPDERGEGFAFHVNGVPTYVRGANWIPDDSFPARTTPARLRRLLGLAVEAGMNMLRIWGGGIYETEDFYDLCDELGLLVWQDFPYACALYADDDEAAEVARAEATAAVRRLRNHASLAIWCGNNENQWLGWMGAWGALPRILGDRLYDEVLPDVVAAEDPDRPYWPSSPWGHEANPSDDPSGDSHYWNVWHGEGDWVHYAKCTSRFVSEFGFSAAADLRTLAEVLPAGDLGADTPGVRWHDKTNKGYETYLGYVSLHYPRPTTGPDLVYFSQLNQADAMRFGIEHFRRLRPHNMGVLVWQLNDLWPVQSWAWVDSALRPKAAWYAARQFYAPLLLSLWRDGDTVRAHLVNDTAEPASGPLTLRVVDAAGAVLAALTVDASIAPGASAEALALALSPEVLAAASRAVVHASFAGTERTLLLVEPKDLSLPAAAVRIAVRPDGEDTVLTLESDTLALGVQLGLEDADATWSANFVDLFPGEPREVVVTPWSHLGTPEVAARLRWRSL